MYAIRSYYGRGRHRGGQPGSPCGPENAARPGSSACWASPCSAQPAVPFRIADVFRRHKPQVVLHLGRVGNLRVSKDKRFDLNVVGSAKIIVITSYSIHYTKLYDSSSAWSDLVRIGAVIVGTPVG